MTCMSRKVKMVNMVTPVTMVSLVRIGTFGQKDQNSMLSASGASFLQTWCEATDMRRENLVYNPFQVLLALSSRNQFNLIMIYRVFFFTGTPLKVSSTKKLIKARLGVSRTIYVNVDSPT